VEGYWEFCGWFKVNSGGHAVEYRIFLKHADIQLQMFLVTAESLRVLLATGTGRLECRTLFRFLLRLYYAPTKVFPDERLDEAFVK
jgi:hypothetical protein